MIPDPSTEPEEPLRYAVAGGEMPSTAESLEKYSGTVVWTYLKPHFESGALLYVDPSLSLSGVGAAIAADDKAQVEAWLKSGDLLKPGVAHAQHWESSKESFSALVVSPFVLMQPAK